MTVDLLAHVPWTCTATEAGVADVPALVDGAFAKWWPASVPGTAAGAMRRAGLWDVEDRQDFDATDWWFRCRFDAPDGPGDWLLGLGGLATIADVWLNGTHVLHSENMFLAHLLEVALLRHNELTIRCAALTPLLGLPRPRPRWKTRLVQNQNLRWFRSTLLGRMPGWADVAAPVGPWRPVRVEPAPPVRVAARRLVVSCDGRDGLVDLTLRLRGDGAKPGPAVLRAGGIAADLDVRSVGEDLEVGGTVRVPETQRWWPHTHGPQPRYGLSLSMAGHVVDLGRVGFRTVEADRSDDGFGLVVNGAAVFCRGACWVPPDVVTMAASPTQVRSSLELMRAGQVNMVRVTGTTVYEDAHFWELCDDLGILVWQDCMFANLDPPDNEAFISGVEEELEQVFTGLQARPSLAVISGGSEIEQQAAMLGLARERYALPLLQETIPTLADRLLPGVPYLSNSPCGGYLPFEPDSGVSHYYGVGAYLRPPSDVRRAGVRFAAECLAFSVPPERETVRELLGGPTGGARPGCKLAVPRDAGSAWDFEDVRDFYVRLLFDVDPAQVHSVDPERAIDLGLAAVVELMAGVMSEWRRPGSTCAGGLVFTWQDMWPGAGWGVLDALGRPKAPWFTLRRAWHPLALFLVDEGLNGLRLYVVNDTAAVFSGTVQLEVYANGEHPAGDARGRVCVPARRGVEMSTDELFGGFRDLGYAYRFGPPDNDVVVATLLRDDGMAVSEAIHLPLGVDRSVEADLGLEARSVAGPDGSWTVRVTTRRFAQYVAFDVAGFRPADSWFHLAPGASRTVVLEPDGSQDRPQGEVRALNSRAVAPLVMIE